jgi:sugar/nucleoside kinase (ribokinase family)
MNFITVGTKPSSGILNPNDAPELYTAVGAGLISETGLILNKGSKLSKKIENSLKNVTIQKGSDELQKRFFKPIALHLSSGDPKIQSDILEKMRPRKIASIDTHKKWIKKKTNHLSNLKDDVDVIFLNQEEASLLSGENDPMKSALKLSNGCVAVVKMGAKGCVVADDEVWHLPAFPVEVVDDKYAGDAFAGAFIAYLSKRPSLTKAAMYANVVASYVVEGRGIEKLISAKRKDVRKRYKQYLKMF